MCARHFQDEDIEWHTSHFDQKTGIQLTAPLPKPRLRKGAIPSKLPNCPAYLSTNATTREAPDLRRIRKEVAAVKAAVAQSVAAEMQHKQQRAFASLEELKGKLNFLDSKYWAVISQEQALLIVHIDNCPNPTINLSVAINEHCEIQVFVKDVEVHRLGDCGIPAQVNDIHVLEDILLNLRKCDTKESEMSPNKFLFLLQLVISLLMLIQET